MEDIRLERPCDHVVIDEFLTLDGTSPNYFAYLSHPSNKDTSVIQIREWGKTEGLTNYNYNIDGMTNWSLDSGGIKINFNTLGIGSPGSASFVDGSTLIYPVEQYLTTYRTLRDNCPKCGGTDYSKDIYFNEYGRIEIVSGSTKLVQYIRKAIMTEIGSNEFFENYGSTLSEIIGRKFTVASQANLQKSVYDAVNHLIEIQKEVLDLTPEESILKIKSIDILQDNIDPRALRVHIAILNTLYKESSVVFSLFS